ncbi:MAG: alcohol dehydrogenase catalytic domain-containing protein [Candidatus Parvarchaeota archaeon]|nr:alcohol dehydrogenase catalytic domain-containing protein [Candidatus Jingweiarchaeum tengchongense]
MKIFLIETPGVYKYTEKAYPVLPDKNESILKVLGCGICGTDPKIYKGETIANYPLIPGHEIMGIIEESSEFEKGQFVTIDPNKACGKCHFCRIGKPNLCQNLEAVGVTRDGGFAEYVKVDNSQIFMLEKSVPVERGIFSEPLSCILNGFERSNFSFVSDVAIIGGGAIGSIFGMLSKRFTIGKVIIFEIAQERRSYIEKDLKIFSSDPREYKGKKFDTVFECSGTTEGLNFARNIIEDGGTIVIFGVTPHGKKSEIEPFDVYKREYNISGSYVNPYTMEKAVKIINSGEFLFEKLASDVVELDKVFEFVTSNKKPFMKAIYKR